jgi:hypothetical protein
MESAIEAEDGAALGGLGRKVERSMIEGRKPQVRGLLARNKHGRPLSAGSCASTIPEL